MTGAELIKWIQSNQAEDLPVSVLSSENEYLKVKCASIKETDDSTIVLTCYREEDTEQEVIADIIAEIKEEKDAILSGVKLSPGEKGCIEEYRRKYWAYLVRCMNKYYGLEGPYRKIRTSKSVVLEAGFGIGKFYISCEALINGARVEVVLKKTDGDFNRLAYKCLMEQQGDIEKELGTKLNWWAEDDWKYCYVDKSYQGKTNILDESTWEDMAKFHMEWSRKFYDVIVPRLKKWYEGYQKGAK